MFEETNLAVISWLFRLFQLGTGVDPFKITRYIVKPVYSEKLKMQFFKYKGNLRLPL